MHERTQDAMCYVRKYSRPDLFITFTCNPNWTDITSNLFKNQTSQDRHDIVARVFHLKLKKLLHILIKDKVFGSVKCQHVHSGMAKKRVASCPSFNVVRYQNSTRKK